MNIDQKNAAEKRAAALYMTDWDENGAVSAHFPREIVWELLRARGWNFRRGAWLSPSGVTYWETEDALRIALTAEVV